MKRREGGHRHKENKATSKVTIKVEKESALSLFGRSDQEEAECKRKGGR